MEITTLKEYVELVWNAPSVDELSDKAWYDIALYAQDGFKWDMELVAIAQRPIPAIPKNICSSDACILPLDIKAPASPEVDDAQADKKAEDLFF